MSIDLDPGKTVLAVCKPGEYSGRDAQKKLNVLATSIHEKVKSACSIYSKNSLLESFYDLFDKSCYMSIDGTHWITDDEYSLKILLKSPSISRYLLETSLCYGGSKNNKELTSETIRNFFSIGQLFVETCNSSNYLYYGGFSGGFKVYANGDVEDVVSEKTRKAMEVYFEKLRIRKAQIIKGSQYTRPEEYFNGFVSKYGKLFGRTYGVDLAFVVQAVMSMFRLRKGIIVGTVRIARKDLINKLAGNGDKQNFDKALKLLEITKDYLMMDWKYYKLYYVPVSVVRRPVINLSGKIGSSGMLLYGGNAALYSLAMLFDDIERGIVELDLDVDSLSDKRGRDFERKLLPELRQYGFNVIHIKDTPAKVGDIDAVAAREEKGILMVIEAKSPRINIDASRIRKQMENSQEWYAQLERKVQWVKENLESVKEKLKVNKNTEFNVEGIIIVEVPWFYEPHPLFKIVTFDELELFLNSKMDMERMQEESMRNPVMNSKMTTNPKRVYEWLTEKNYIVIPVRLKNENKAVEFVSAFINHFKNEGESLTIEKLFDADRETVIGGLMFLRFRDTPENRRQFIEFHGLFYHDDTPQMTDHKPNEIEWQKLKDSKWIDEHLLFLSDRIVLKK